MQRVAHLESNRNLSYLLDTAGCESSQYLWLINAETVRVRISSFRFPDKPGLSQTLRWGGLIRMSN
jgi:hypothetical protein